MTRGLVIGKFLPIHNGHIALIQYAATACDELIVSMSYTNQDAIDPLLRLSWIKEIFKNNPNIKPLMILDDFDEESLPLLERTKIWADVIKKTYASINVLFSSEGYGEPFAKHLNAVHKIFDLDRKQVPVSSTLIRNQPFAYWDFIPEIVRPYFVKIVCFYGPESTGKSVMAKYMSEKYKTEFVPEVAREIVTSNDFTLDDIVKVGYAQHERIQKKLKTANKILFCDTDAITTQIYSKYYLNSVPEVLYELEEKTNYLQYFLFDVDVPWIADDLRDLGEKRTEMYTLFKQALEERKINYIPVKGTYQEREIFITAIIEKLLQ